MPWTVYRIHVRPLSLRDPERFAPGTLLRVVDPATRKQLPPEGAIVRVKSREIECYWNRTERAGDVEITMADEATSVSFARAKPAARPRATKAAADDEVTP